MPTKSQGIYTHRITIAPLAPQLGQTKENYSIRHEVGKLIEDSIVSKFFGICVALNVYAYTSHYIFYWYGLTNDSQTVYDYYQPLAYFLGAMACGGFLAIKYDFKNAFVIIIIGNIITLIVSLVGTFINNETIVHIG